MTAGEIRGTVLSPGKRGPTFIGKLGFDRQMNKDLRVRLTGSMYRIGQVAEQHALWRRPRRLSLLLRHGEHRGDRVRAEATSGLINPGFKNEVHAMQMNPFVKFRGLEVFGVIERAKGSASTEAADRKWNQYAVDTVYRFLPTRSCSSARATTRQRTAGRDHR